MKKIVPKYHETLISFPARATDATVCPSNAHMQPYAAMLHRQRFAYTHVCVYVYLCTTTTIAECHFPAVACYDT